METKRLEREELLSRMLAALESSGALPSGDTPAVLTELLKREDAAPTAFGLGVAIPHCFLRNLGPPRLAVACCKPGIDFGGPEGELTYVVFLLVEDIEQRAGHNALLSRIARVCQQTGLVRRLRGARHPTEVARLLQREDARLG